MDLVDGSRCTALCEDGSPCNGWAAPGTDPPLCPFHGSGWKGFCPISHPCGATTKDGSPCRSRAVLGSQPARCSAHGGIDKPIGAPKGNQYGRTHGYYAKTDRPEDRSIHGLLQWQYERHLRVTRYMDRILASEDASEEEIVALFTLAARSCGRLCELLRRSQRARSREEAALWENALTQALQELGAEWGIDLCPGEGRVADHGPSSGDAARLGIPWLEEEPQP